MIPTRTATFRQATLVAWLACVLAFLAPRVTHAQIAAMPRELEHVGVTEHLDGPLPLDAAFRDHTGAPVTLGKYFDGKRPLVLQFAYFTCPVVCGMITNNLAAGLKGIPWTIGDQYDVVTISIDPNESLERTAQKRASILREYGRAKDNQGWHFLTGSQASIDAVTKAIGFEYQYDERQQQWGHPSVVFVVKPSGRIARYLYGLEFPPADLRLGLLEASEGRHISTVEQIILYCYHYDPQGGKYVLVARRVMQVGGGLVALVLFGFLGLFWGREWKKKRALQGLSGTSTPNPDETPPMTGSSGLGSTNDPSDPRSANEAAHPPLGRAALSIRGG
jgi:protein SCO1/2